MTSRAVHSSPAAAALFSGGASLVSIAAVGSGSAILKLCLFCSSVEHCESDFFYARVRAEVFAITQGPLRVS